MPVSPHLHQPWAGSNFSILTCENSHVKYSVGLWEPPELWIGTWNEFKKMLNTLGKDSCFARISCIHTIGEEGFDMINLSFLLPTVHLLLIWSRVPFQCQHQPSPQSSTVTILFGGFRTRNENKNFLDF